jgi:hypothetical protein
MGRTEHRLPRRRPLFVEFAVRGADPAERHRAILEHRVVGKPDHVAVTVQLLQRHEHVEVVGGTSPAATTRF